MQKSEKKSVNGLEKKDKQIDRSFCSLKESSGFGISEKGYKDIHQVSYEKKIDSEKNSSKEKSIVKKTSPKRVNKSIMTSEINECESKECFKKEPKDDLKGKALSHEVDVSIDSHKFQCYKPLNKYSEFLDFRPKRLQSPKYIALRKPRPIAGKIIKNSNFPISTPSSLSTIDKLIS